MTLAPIGTAGSVQTTALTRRSTGGDKEHTLQQSGTIVLDTFLWEPWIATADGELSIAQEQNFGDEKGSSLLGSGSATLAVLPRSNYPVTLSLSHLDSRVAGEFSGSDFILDRAAVTARATPSDSLRGGVNASWDRSDREDSGVQNAGSLSLDVNRSFMAEESFLGLRSIGVGASVRTSDFVADDPTDDDRNRDTFAFSFSSRSEPFERVNYDNVITASYDDIVDGDETFERLSLNGISSFDWQPLDRAYVVTGTLRTLAEQITETEAAQVTESNTTLASGTVALRWPISDRLSMNAGLRGSYQDITRDDGGRIGESGLNEGTGLSATALAGLNYLSEARKLGAYEWQWNTSAQTENGVMEEEGAIARETFTIGHRFERTLDGLVEVPVRFSFDQEADASIDTTDDDDPFSIGLSHSLSLDYATAGPASSRFVRAFLRDSRNVIGEQREFQSLQGRFGQRIAFDRDRRLQADVNGQFLRSVTEDDDDLFVTVSGNVAFENRNFYDIEDLTFRSELRVNFVQVESLFIEREDEFGSEFARNDWRNILAYRIGRLVAELEGTVFQRDEDPGYLLLFRLRRDFGGGA